MTIVNQLQRICNKIIRTAFGLNRQDGVKEIMIKNKLLTINQLYINDVAVFMYKLKQGHLPRAFSNFFQLRRSHVNTRSSSQLISSSYRTACFQQSIKFVGPKFWNSLPKTIQNCKTLSSFKKHLLEHYISHPP